MAVIYKDHAHVIFAVILLFHLFYMKMRCIYFTARVSAPEHTRRLFLGGRKPGEASVRVCASKLRVRRFLSMYDHTPEESSGKCPPEMCQDAA